MITRVRVHCVLVLTRAVSVRDHIDLTRAVRVRVGRTLDLRVRSRVYTNEWVCYVRVFVSD